MPKLMLQTQILLWGSRRDSTTKSYRPFFEPLISVQITLFTLMCVLFSCKSQEKNSIPQYCNLAQNSKIWDVYDDSIGSFLVKGQKLEPIKNDYKDIVSAINDKYPNLHIRIEKKINDTLFIKIDSSTEFTQRMGTSGALAYKSVIVFSLMESDSIRGVFLDFKEGDHGGVPGLLTKKDLDGIAIKKCD